MTIKSKFITILCSLGCLLISALLLIGFFSFKPTINKNNIFLNVADLQIGVGQYVELNVNIPQESRLVKCETINKEIAVVNDGYVFGVSEGTTYVKVEVKFKDENVSKLAQVVVKSSDKPGDNMGNYDFEISEIYNCQFKDGAIYYKDGAQFTASFHGLGWGSVHDVNFTSDIKAYREISKYVISDNRNGYLFFTSIDGKYTLALNCVYVQNL